MEDLTAVVKKRKTPHYWRIVISKLLFKMPVLFLLELLMEIRSPSFLTLVILPKVNCPFWLSHLTHQGDQQIETKLAKPLELLLLLFHSNHALQWESSRNKAVKGQVGKSKLAIPSSLALRLTPFHKSCLLFLTGYLTRLQSEEGSGGCPLPSTTCAVLQASWIASFSLISVQLISEIASIRLSTLF